MKREREREREREQHLFSCQCSTSVAKLGVKSTQNYKVCCKYLEFLANKVSRATQNRIHSRHRATDKENRFTYFSQLSSVEPRHISVKVMLSGNEYERCRVPDEL